MVDGFLLLLVLTVELQEQMVVVTAVGRHLVVEVLVINYHKILVSPELVNMVDILVDLIHHLAHHLVVVEVLVLVVMAALVVHLMWEEQQVAVFKYHLGIVLLTVMPHYFQVQL